MRIMFVNSMESKIFKVNRGMHNVRELMLVQASIIFIMLGVIWFRLCEPAGLRASLLMLGSGGSPFFAWLRLAAEPVRTGLGNVLVEVGRSSCLYCSLLFDLLPHV